MNYAVLDVESTIFKKGHPFATRNKLCFIGLRLDAVNGIYPIEYGGRPYGEALREVQTKLSSVDCVVGFNLKFDLNWLARYGISLPDHVRVFDCQLAEFILNHQRTPFPSLDDCCVKYGLGTKLDIVDREYWSRGIDTDQIPVEVIVPYLEKDLELTDALFPIVRNLVESKNLGALAQLHMQDLRVLQEMEFNGIRLDWAKMEQRAAEVEKELNAVKTGILEFVPETFRSEFNSGSNDHVSLLLYGGIYKGRVPQPYTHIYKTGPNKGSSVVRNKWEELSIEFPRLVDPLPKSELAKPGFWSTGEDILRELPKPKRLLKLLMRESELSKLLSTYYHGLRKKYEEMDWNDLNMHSQLNQSVVITGRLSSSNPNQQNFPPEMDELIISRYNS